MNLQTFFKENPVVALGFSGGVDSSYLLYAGMHYGAKIKAYYVKAAFQPQFEFEDALRMASILGADMTVIETDILSVAHVAENPSNRCYYCKTAIFSLIKETAVKDGYTILLDGTNASDDSGDRPGMKALEELSIRSPLKESGITKSEVRRLSKEAGLFTWDKPAYACLATRVPAGTVITAEALGRIERAENALFAMGFTDFRVRLTGSAAKLQFPESQMTEALKRREEIRTQLQADFDSILLDLAGRKTEGDTDMSKEHIQHILEDVEAGRLSSKDALLKLKLEPFEDIGFAKVDNHRALRQGIGEVIYGASKTPEQIIKIVDVMLQNGQKMILITRMSAEAAESVMEHHPMSFYKGCGIGIIGEIPVPDGLGTIVIATGGTSDIPVAEEAALTAEALGNKVVRLYDVGVAGLHRLMSHKDEIMSARVVIAIAGMEGALASVIGGLVDCPVIGVPTSVGYGASFGGLSALLSMLNSCASGVSVVNIDNGFGAGYLASMINHMEGK